MIMDVIPLRPEGCLITLMMAIKPTRLEQVSTYFEFPSTLQMLTD